MAPSKTGVNHDAITQVLLGVLAEFDVDYDEHPQYPIADLRRSQVRDEKNVAKPEMVRALRAKLQAGIPLPAIVITANDKIVDGNTRKHAIMKEKHQAAYVIKLRKTDEELGDELLEILGNRMNDHSRRLSSPEMDRSIRTLIEGGATTERIMQHVSVGQTRVQDLRAIMKAEQRLAEYSLPNSFTGSHMKQFGRADLLRQPFEELVRLTKDAGLAATDLRNTIKRVRSYGSEAEQLQFLRDEREALGEQIAEHKRSGNGKPPAGRRAKQSLSAFLAIPNADEELVERAPERMDDHLKVLVRSLNRLQAVIEAQRAAAVIAGVTLV